MKEQAQLEGRIFSPFEIDSDLASKVCGNRTISEEGTKRCIEMAGGELNNGVKAIIYEHNLVGPTVAHLEEEDSSYRDQQRTAREGLYTELQTASIHHIDCHYRFRHALLAMNVPREVVRQLELQEGG